MNRQQLAHILRASCDITGDKDVLVIGSQSILGSHDEDELPVEATASIEADIAFLDDLDRGKADDVEGAIGEFSTFQATHGIYAEGVHLETAVLPDGWRNRLVSWDLVSSAPAEPHFLEAHDLAVSKLAAGRDKDKAFVDALIRHALLDVQTLRERNDLLAGDHQVHKNRIRTFLDLYSDSVG
ncbi:hypothetical protein GCM10023169_17370 [Georgenia halophila]|uniref:DUF6036 domain-containing protein n=1 Tax=Georgenia halophila TaxID=620889 RepID=A0ABP8L6J3_9MICO